MESERIFKLSFASVYPFYVKKAEKKNRTKEEVDEIICWLTGYDLIKLKEQIDNNVSFELFFNQAPRINPNSFFIKGTICGIRVEDIENPLMQKFVNLE